jgi:hypothetical protein
MVISAPEFAIAFRRDHSLCADILGLRYQNVVIVASVSDHRCRLLTGQQLRCRSILPGLAGGNAELQRQSVLVS